MLRNECQLRAMTSLNRAEVTLLVFLLYDVISAAGAAADAVGGGGGGGCVCTTGALVGAVVGTFCGTLVLCCLALFILYRLRIRHMLDKVKECQHNHRGIDNATFGTEEEPNVTNIVTNGTLRHTPSDSAKKGVSITRLASHKQHAATEIDKKKMGGGGGRSLDRHKPVSTSFHVISDTSEMNHQISTQSLDRHGDTHQEIIEVALKSSDALGLGFHITGSLADGIFVSQVQNRGPAFESGLVAAGDRILRLTVAFEHLAFEDALTILSYAAPYPVQLLLAKESSADANDETGDSEQEESTPGDTDLHLHPQRVSSNLAHPMYRSRSVDQLDAKRRVRQQAAAGERRGSDGDVMDSTSFTGSGYDVKRQEDNGGDGEGEGHDAATLQIRKWRAAVNEQHHHHHHHYSPPHHQQQRSTWVADDARFRKNSIASTASDVTDAAVFAREVSITVHRAATPDNGLQPTMMTSRAESDLDRRSPNIRPGEAAGRTLETGGMRERASPSVLLNIALQRSSKTGSTRESAAVSDNVGNDQLGAEATFDSPSPPHPFSVSAAEHHLTMADALGDYFMNANPSLADEIIDSLSSGAQTQTTEYNNRDSSNAGFLHQQKSPPTGKGHVTNQNYDLHLHRNVSINSRHGSEVNNNDVSNTYGYPATSDAIFALQNHRTLFTSAFSPINTQQVDSEVTNIAFDNSENRILALKQAAAVSGNLDFQSNVAYVTVKSTSPNLPEEVSQV